MKTKNKIFDLSLCIEGMRLLRVLGFISFIIYLTISFLIPYNYSGDDYIGRMDYSTIDFLAHDYVIFMLVVPALTLFLFSFLLKRNSSDFFHSIPHKKICVFVSFFMSIMIWTFIIEFSAALFSVIFAKIFISNIVFDFAYIFKTLLGIYIASMAVCAGILMAVSITGNFLSNVIVSGFILLAPKIFADFFLDQINKLAYNVFDVESFFPVLFGKYNLVTSFMSVSDFTEMGNAKYQLYTFILFAIMFVAALILFNKRKSEVAGNAASYKFLQDVYRIVFTMILCLLPLNMIFEDYGKTGIISLYVIILIFYFVYEIVTTKSVKNLIKIIPGIFIVIILNVCIIFGVKIVSKRILNYKPEIKDMSAVEIMMDSSNYRYYRGINNFKIKVEDEAGMKNLIAALDATIRFNRDGILENEELGESYRVCYYEKNGEKYYRNVVITPSRLKAVLKAVTKEKSGYTIPKLPDAGYFDELNYSYDYMFSFENCLNTNDLTRIYEAYRKDYDNMSDYEKLARTFNVHNENSYCVLYLDLYKAGINYLEIGIDESTENAYNEFLDIISNKKLINLKDKTDDFKSLFVQNDYIDVYLYDGLYISVDKNVANYNLGSDEKSEEFFECMDELLDYAVTDVDEFIELSGNDDTYKYSIRLDTCIQIGNKTYDSIYVLIEKNDKTEELMNTLHSFGDSFGDK